MYNKLLEREMIRDSRKAERRKALPLRYKALCWFGVVPLFVSGPVVLLALPGIGPYVFFGTWAMGIVAYASLEIACVTWYKANGYL